ncbi:MFS transporter [Novosphingobium sp. FSY-8]|uniref:MFS transporter n=1 Tax=Novosphingobium ovatum TaxID=1908523 RepID=A0ABW9XDM5_9SPHN|nr:MFS transporter [Novosphingobium ovatum]NBC36631.1 MFS transporter [Novosphingobium ovatum]
MTTPATAEAPAPDQPDHTDARPWPSPVRGWLLVGLLALASIVSQFDRTVINLMVEPIKGAFGLNDTQFGMLQGVAFGIFYITACVPIGRLADRYQRRVIIGVALALWSLFAMGSGLARGYWQLFLTRIGVAVGEASLSPAAFSLLSDQFPPERLGKPLSGFLMSAPIGQGLAFMGGGSLLVWLNTSPVMHGALFSGLAPWQAAFIIVALPGLVLAPLFFLFPEPLRRGTGGRDALPAAEVWGIVRDRARALAPMFASFACVSLVSYAFAIWTPALLSRSYGWSPQQIGWSYGPMLMVFGTGGVWMGGWLSDRLAARGHSDAPLRVAAGGFAIGGVCGALAPLMPSAELALALLAPTVFFGNFPYPCAATSIQLIVPNRARAQVSALYITLTTLVGLAIGPMVIGAITDYVFRNPHEIRYSMALVVGMAAPTMVGLLLLALRPYRALRDA